MSVIDEIAAERRRQIEVEGWTPEHDDGHQGGELARAAAAYAAFSSIHPIWRKDHTARVRSRVWGTTSIIATLWPFQSEWFKPTTPRHELIKAAALIVAEIERLDRREPPNAA